MERRKTVWQLLQWCAAVLISFLIVNCTSFFYFNRPAWLGREQGATIGVYRPGKTIIYAYEGFGISHTDHRGYINPEWPLAQDYILAMGASHTQGKEVMQEDNYCSCLNRKLTEQEELRVYNIAVDGNYYPAIVQHFSAALQEFPDAAQFIIEITTTDFDREELENSVASPVSFSEETVGDRLAESLSLKQRIVAAAKETAPLAVLLAYKQLSGIDPGFEGAFFYQQPDAPVQKQAAYSEPEHLQALENTMAYLRSCTEKPILIFYHPELKLGKDGTVELVRSSGTDSFAELCGRYGIAFLDVGDYFLEMYQSTGKLPYGFANSTPGAGHMNRFGHAWAAEAIYQKLLQEKTVNAGGKVQ